MPGIPSIETPMTTLNQELKFDHDSDAFQNGGTLSFTLASRGNVNGVGKIIRVNQPTAISFSSDFVADANSAAIDTTKLNMILFVYFENWDGADTKKVVYCNKVFDAI